MNKPAREAERQVDGIFDAAIARERAKQERYKRKVEDDA